MSIYTTAITIKNQREFRPTYLCIKQHSITKKLYLCKTTNYHNVMLDYLGSGTYWNKHIIKHGKEFVDTIWYCLFTEKESIKEFALMCSEQWNIVNSKEWANFKPENGLDGGSLPGSTHTPITCPYCSKIGGSRTMKRWHFANCKLNPNRSEESKIKSTTAILKQSTIHRGTKHGQQPIVICPHCDKSGGVSGMKQSHFDNCKLNPNRSAKSKLRSIASNTSKALCQKGMVKGPHKIIQCPHCGKKGGISNMKRYHFENCKLHSLLNISKV